MININELLKDVNLMSKLEFYNEIWYNSKTDRICLCAGDEKYHIMEIVNGIQRFYEGNGKTHPFSGQGWIKIGIL